MKKLITLLMLCIIVLLSCNSNSKTEPALESAGVTQAERLVITDTIKSLINGFIKAANEVNAIQLCSFFSRSPEFRAVDQNGMIIHQTDTLEKFVRNYYRDLARQDIKLVEPYINVLSPELAVAVYSAEFTATGKDSSTAGGPFGWTLVFSKEPSGWKILNLHQSIKWRETSLNKLVK